MPTIANLNVKADGSFDLLAEMPDTEEHAVVTRARERFELPGGERTAGDFDQRFRHGERSRVEARGETAREDHGSSRRWQAGETYVVHGHALALLSEAAGNS